MKEILLLILGGVLANNYAFEKFLGVSPMLGYSRRGSKLLAMGLAVTVVMLLTAAIAWPVQGLLEQYALGYLQILVYVAIILIVVYLVDLVAKAAFHKCLGVYFPLIALNSAVLGLALENVSEGYGYGQALAAAGEHGDLHRVPAGAQELGREEGHVVVVGVAVAEKEQAHGECLRFVARGRVSARTGRCGRGSP